MSRSMPLNHLTIVVLSTIAIVSIAVISTLPSGPTVKAQKTGLAIRNVRYVKEGTLSEPVDILIEKGRIQSIDVAGKNEIAAELESIDGTDLYAVPGLIDAHTHSYGSALEDGLNFGVTATLDMATHVGLLAQMATQRDTLAMTDRTDLFSAGMLATAPGGHGTQFGMPVEPLEDTNEVDRWITTRKKEGSDYIKLVYMPYQGRYPSIDLALAQKLIKSAHEHNLIAVAHIHSQQGALELLEAGIDGFVHMFADSEVSDAFVAQAVARRIFFIPTLTVLASASGRHPGSELIADESIAQRLSIVQAQQLQHRFGVSIQSMAWQVGFANTAKLAAAGVPILAGSDAPNPGTTAGASLHQELSYLVEAGLSPSAALAAATYLPTEYFSLTDRGTITVDARADLLLLDTNPLENIEATRTIASIIKNGGVHDPN